MSAFAKAIIAVYALSYRFLSYLILSYLIFPSKFSSIFTKEGRRVARIGIPNTEGVRAVSNYYYLAWAGWKLEFLHSMCMPIELRKLHNSLQLFTPPQ
jgi:hypothetical protein